MDKKKNITLIFNHFEVEHLGKDVYLVPYYLGKVLNYDVTIVYPLSETNKKFPNEIKGIKLVPLPLYGNNKSHFLYREVAFFNYAIKKAKEIDILIRFHHTFQTEIISILFKRLNPQGKVFVKLDINPSQIENKTPRRYIKEKIHNYITRKFIKSTSVATCETTQAYKLMKESFLIKNQWNEKLFLLPNGFDEELLKSFHLKEKKFTEKENLFITVGRLGTPPKNTEMILQALSMVEMKDWKFLLIGPIEDNLKSTIEEFYRSNPDKKNSVTFTGPIYDKKELWEYYNRAKVFVLTSRWESYALVLNEANRFRNYILSTNVGAFEDITQNSRYGSVIEQEQPKSLAGKLQEIINGKLEIDVYNDFNPLDISWQKQIEILSDKLK